MRILFYLSFFLIINIAAARDSASVLDPESLDNLYQGAKDISKTLLAKCSPPDCHIIGLGRSPAIITTFLQGLNPELATNLPLGGFRYNPHLKNGPHPSRSALSAGNEKKLFKHFDEFLSPLITKRYKKFLILDYSVSGRSIFAATAYIEKFLKTKGISNPELISAPIIGRNHESDYVLRHAEDYKIKNHFVIKIEDDWLSKTFYAQETDDLAEYRSFDLLRDRKAKINKKKDQKLFVKSMRERMGKDLELEELAPYFCSSHLIKPF